MDISCSYHGDCFGAFQLRGDVVQRDHVLVGGEHVVISKHLSQNQERAKPIRITELRAQNPLISWASGCLCLFVSSVVKNIP